jgi:pimeloyl-ACP methyl ester carboxylesterase
MEDDMTEGKAEVNGVSLWYRISGQGEPIVQLHGCGFGHHNFEPVSARLAERFKVVDFDQRGFGLSDRPLQHYDMDVWADDAAALMDVLGIERAHIHGTSMGGMIAIVFAGKYPERTSSVAINCAAARVGTAGRLIFKNWIDIVRLDPDGVGSRLLAELIAWQALSKAFLVTSDGATAVDSIQQILRDGNSDEVFVSCVEAMRVMDIRPWLARITRPALVIGGDEDIMTPWDQGPDGAGQEAIFQGIAGAEKYVVPRSNHTCIFDNTDDYVVAVTDFFARHAAGSSQ